MTGPKLKESAILFERNDILRFRYPSEQPYVSETVTKADKPVGVAIDQLYSHVYLTEYGTGKLYRCNLDGSNKIVVLQDDPLYAITLDNSNRWMYYSTYTTNGNIKKARLNGTEKQTIINSPHRIYDATGNQLYWMEYNSGDLKSSTFNGENEIKVVGTNAVSTNIGIHVYGSNIICATKTTIINVTVSTTSTTTNILHSDPERIFSVIVLNEKYCDYKNGYIYFKRHDLNVISRFRYPSDKSYKEEDVTTAEQPISLVIDPVYEHVYWTERYTGKICRCNFNRLNKACILKDDRLYGITLDNRYRWLYYSTFGTTRKIRKARLNGSENQTVIESVEVTGLGIGMLSLGL
ncbi:VLDLR [Mytilus edulis]|uniref:VLDLR n=1 Tax=Mytilus edulis TaxID=6550 RepID=A0A8S3UDV4_MYTED|nr:VLDLR [Mytilus edulis]